MGIPAPSFGEYSGIVSDNRFLSAKVRAELETLLPATLSSASRAQFLDATAEWVQLAVAEREVEPAAPASVRERIAALGVAAHTMRNALSPFAGDQSPYFVALDGRMEVLRLATDGDTGLPDDTPALAALLARLWADLEALRVSAEYAAFTLSVPGGKPEARTAEWLVHVIAGSFKAATGTWPRLAWFVDFMESVARSVNLPCGRDRVSAGLSFAKANEMRAD